MNSSVFRTAEWNFDIDHYLNHVVPPSPLHRLPTPVSRFLGYRKEQQQDVGNIAGAFWSCLGAFCGLGVIAAIFNNSPSIAAHHPPAFIASFGASAILEYNAIRSPLGQPRNALLGHTLSAIVGVGITKLFMLNPDFEHIKWIAGAVSCGAASAVMLLTNTVHPPGGASAVLAATTPEITAMGWYFVPLVMLGTTLMLLVGLVLNNIQRQFPVYWWTPLDLRKAKKADPETVPDAQGGVEVKNDAGGHTEDAERGINISASGVSLPDDLSLNPHEAQFLHNLRTRLRRLQEEEKEKEDSTSSRSSTECTMVPSWGARSDSDASAFFS